MWIGSTALNVGGTHINVGTITSPDASLTIGYSSPNITIQSNGSTTGKTITGNTGGALSPTAGNWNIPGINSALTGYSPWTTGSGSTLTVNMPGTVKWVVNPVAGLGTHTTITAALAAASSGENIFITPGTYTENLTLKAGVNIVGYFGDALSGNVTILGKCTATFTGSCYLSGIRLQTNTDYFLEVSGSNATIVFLENCFLECSNNTGINYTSSSSSSRISMRYCEGNLSTTGIALYTMTSPGTIFQFWCKISNPGLSVTASNNSAGQVSLFYCNILFFLSTSSTGVVKLTQCNLTRGDLNTTCVTTAGTGTSSIDSSILESGTASAISVGSGTTVNCYNTTISSTNNNAVTGAGTLNYSNLTFSNTSSVMNTTTQAATYTNLGKWKASGQPAFLATSAGASNITGDGTVVTLVFGTEIFDQDNNFDGTSTFTAPVTGRYQFTVVVQVTNLSASFTNGNWQIVTSNRSYPQVSVNWGTVFQASTSVRIAGSAFADMDAGDTTTITLLISGGTKTVGTTATTTTFAGFLAC